VRPYLKNKQSKWTRDVDQVLMSLPGKHKVLSSNPSPSKQTKSKQIIIIKKNIARADIGAGPAWGGLDWWGTISRRKNMEGQNGERERDFSGALRQE
jgi:hypothetical protein